MDVAQVLEICQWAGQQNGRERDDSLVVAMVAIAQLDFITRATWRNAFCRALGVDLPQFEKLRDRISTMVSNRFWVALVHRLLTQETSARDSSARRSPAASPIEDNSGSCTEW